MRLFSLGKKKEQGWDEEAAIEFHSKAPPANGAAGNLPNIDDNSQPGEVSPMPESENPSESMSSESLSNPVTSISRGKQNQMDTNVAANETASTKPSSAVAPTEIKKNVPDTGSQKNIVIESQLSNATTTGRADATAPVVFAKLVSTIPAKNNSAKNEIFDKSKFDPGQIVASVNGPSKVRVDRTAMHQLLDNYAQTVDEATAMGAGLENCLSDLLPVVQQLNAQLLLRKQERVRLTEKTTTLRAEIDALEENAPGFDKKLRALVDDLNIELTRDFVEGVTSVSVPKYDAVNELVEVISTMGKEFAKMLPALENSKEGALGMLQTLRTESQAYAPTKALVDFSVNGIDCIKRFLKNHVDLRNDLQNALKNYDLFSTDYKKAIAENETNLQEIAELVSAIKRVTESFNSAGNQLRSIVPAS
ncbi:MAG: hypothetical protein JXX14_17820 [Deltaproteobacteria bacterium]|nr:hypothetical protein [Deltaproteobacteria bacterium]